MTEVKKITELIPTFNTDGSTNHARAIIAKTCLLIRMSNLNDNYHDKQYKPPAINLRGKNVILWINWLYKHHPQINWINNHLTFTLYSKIYITSRLYITIPMEKPIWPGLKKWLTLLLSKSYLKISLNKIMKI